MHYGRIRKWLKKMLRCSIKFFHSYSQRPLEGGDFSRMCHISLFCLFGQVATFGGLLSREMSSISSGYECLMKVVSLKGFKFYRLWKFRDIDIFGRGGGARRIISSETSFISSIMVVKGDNHKKRFCCFIKHH